MAVPTLIVVLAFVVMVFSIPLVAIWTEHRRKMIELQLKLRSARDASSDQVKDLARQIADLRATATEFDLSFDAALQRLESRMNLMDERLRRLEGVSASGEAEQADQVRLGAR